MSVLSSSFLFILAIFALAILIRWLTPSRGKKGENSVARILKKLLRQDYHVINDVVLPTPYGSSQIDHIVVSPFGIFVIETKNYSGWIYGSEHGEYWTKNVYGHKYDFYNPILQNTGHVTALRKNHGQSIRSAKERKFEAISSGRCPRCGGELVVRSGRYGDFYGCTNYPTCKFTTPIE